MNQDYSDFLIRIGPKNPETGGYIVKPQLGDGATYRGELRLDQNELLKRELDPQEYGLYLFESLFPPGPLRDAYMGAMTRTQQAGQGMRVRLWIEDEAAELHAHRWEMLYHRVNGRPVPLSTAALTPFSRLVEVARPGPQPITERPIRLLLAIANPAETNRYGLTPLDVEKQVAELQKAIAFLREDFGDLSQRGLLDLHLMPGTTGLAAKTRTRLQEEGYQVLDGPTSLAQIMRYLPDVHVAHLFCHGLTDRRTGAAVLQLEGEDDRSDFVSDSDLLDRLAGAKKLPQLMYLAGGEGPKGHGGSPFTKLAMDLVRLGIPAVIAMQDVITIRGASRLTGDFFRGLLKHGFVDLALNEARSLLYDSRPTDWTVPALFTSLRHLQIFATEPVSAPEAQLATGELQDTLKRVQAAVKESHAARAAATDLAARLGEFSKSLRDLHHLSRLSLLLRDLRDLFGPCVTLIRRAADASEIPIPTLEMIWRPVRQGKLYQIASYVEQTPQLETGTWLPELQEGATSIDKDIDGVLLGPLRTHVLTFDQRLAHAEINVRQQLDQGISSLKTASEIAWQTFGQDG